MFIQFFICAAMILALNSCRNADRETLQPPRTDSSTENENAPSGNLETPSPTPMRKTSAQAIARLPKNWRLSLSTSGGIAGRGAGNLTVESNGAVVLEQRVRPASPLKICRANLSADEMCDLRKLLAEWRTPDETSGSKPNFPAPDAFTYALEIRSGAGERLADFEWFDNTYEELPPPNKILIEALSARRETVRRECGESNIE